MNDTMKIGERETAAAEPETPTLSSAVSTALRTATTTLRIVSTAWRGVRAVSALVALARSLDGSDGLAWVRPARRRGPFESAAIFGAGLAVGAGVGVMFAPSPGVDLRRAILGRPAT